jgi:glycosyltransferase involved in cell wall biosynthesis
MSCRSTDVRPNATPGNAVESAAACAGLPLVTVVVPTYRRELSVGRAVQSVLEQSFRDFELIVVDDASDDGTLARLARINDPRLSLFTLSENRGPAAARNVGIRNARGRYVAFLDSDDRWLPDKLEKQLAFMEARRHDVRLSCTGYRYVNPATGDVAERLGKPLLKYDDFLNGCRCAPGSTLVAETSLFRETGLLNEELRRLEDWEWLLRATARSHVGVVQEALSEVHMRLTGRGLYQLVKDAGGKILQVHRGTSAGWSRLRATIDNELAAVSYLDQRYIRAIRHLASASWQHPMDGLHLARRALARARRDISTRLRADVSAGETALGAMVPAGKGST